MAAERPTWYSTIVDVFRPGRADKLRCRSRSTGRSTSSGSANVADRLPSDLSHGQRKLVGVSRALASRPKLILLDEPAAGLDTTESQVLGSHLREFLTRDITVFLIDHDMGLVLNVCDYIYVLDFGRIIAQGTPAEVRANPAVIGAYLGETAGEEQAQEGVDTATSPTPTTPSGPRRRGDPRMIENALIDVKGLSAGYGGAPVVRDLDLHRRPGRGGGAARPERGRQDHHAAHHLGHPAADRRRRSTSSASRSSAARRTRWPAVAWPTSPRTARCSST